MTTKVNIEILLQDESYKILSIFGDAGSTLEKHKVNQSAILLIKEGEISYIQNDITTLLSEGGAFSIPADQYHMIRCEKVSKAFLVIPISAKMRFQKE